MNLRRLLPAFSTLLLAACVTINVYFPAAAAEKAAEEFVGKVIGPDTAPAPAPEPQKAPTPKPLSLLSLLVSDAVAAEPDINIATPAIKALQQRMAERFKAELAAHFDSGALGFTRDGKVELRDAAAIPLAARTAVKQSVADDNRDRDAVYREIALANGHSEWEADIRATFAKQWVAAAHAGWWYQDASGQWRRK
jgi:uncharacterized protein YdbL (DUF1318 family)